LKGKNIEERQHKENFSFTKCVGSGMQKKLEGEEGKEK